jgi:hypothetical protein
VKFCNQIWRGRVREFRCLIDSHPITPRSSVGLNFLVIESLSNGATGILTRKLFLEVPKRFFTSPKDRRAKVFNDIISSPRRLAGLIKFADAGRVSILGAPISVVFLIKLNNNSNSQTKIQKRHEAD